MPTRLSLKNAVSSPHKKKSTASKINDVSVQRFEPDKPAIPPLRVHRETYHRPSLLLDYKTSSALLSWFDSISEARSMPWRMKWIDPESFNGTIEEFQDALTTRAYEVWVSEIMLQQTRVSVVIPYFKNWIAKWPTAKDLAQANVDDVLSVWKGLGYYSRATRLHQGAQKIASESKTPGRIPETAEELQKIPGIGRYTAGAISSIAFGKAAPLLDGNVSRVLSRQLGLYADVKEKKVSDFLWHIADELVQHVAGHSENESSDIPGRWNQALMELGSTICTPRPKCEECPIRKTCRTYTEGEILFDTMKSAHIVPDIEDSCQYCAPLEIEELETTPEEREDVKPIQPSKKQKISSRKEVNQISRYFPAITSQDPAKADRGGPPVNSDDVLSRSNKRNFTPDTDRLKPVVAYCSLFPKKAPKKKPAEEECIVCVIKSHDDDCRSTSQWLIEQRPARGLLASLWQFPLIALPATNDSTAPSRKQAAKTLFSALNIGSLSPSDLRHEAEVGSLTHVFTHLRLTMHVHCFSLSINKACKEQTVREALSPKRKWVDRSRMENETLSTGMRRCWDLVKKQNDWTPKP